MKAVLAALILLVGLLPAPAQAQRPGHHHHSHWVRRGPVIWFPIPFPIPFPYYYPSYPPPVVYREPVYYVAPPPAYVIPPREYESAPAPNYLSNPPAWMTPPSGQTLRQDVRVQREVVYPHGRYVLHGDGVGMPYSWVWVPNPAGAPPAPGSSATDGL